MPNHRGTRVRGFLGRTPPKHGQYIRGPIPDDEKGIEEEVDQMVAYVLHFRADPLIVEVARWIVEKCRERDKKCEAVTIYKWVCKHTRFVDDPHGVEVISTPHKMVREIMAKINNGRVKIKKISGDCDELSTLLASLLTAIGIVPRFRFGGNKQQGVHHVWVQANIDGKWLDMDPSLCKPAGKHHKFQLYASREIFHDY